MPERRHGWAIIGCGVISETHARAVGALDGVELTALVDVVPERAQQLAATYGGEPETDLDRALARTDTDIVSVCVPSGLHAEIGTRAAAARKHVLVEKPIDVTLEAADRLIEAAETAGITLGVVSQHRFDPDVERLHDLIQEGGLGRLLVGDAIIKWYRAQAYYDSGDWRGTRAMDGGALMNQGIHYADLLRWTMGPVESVVARAVTATHKMECEDVAAALLTFQNGGLGVLEATTAVYPGLHERLEVSGTDGTAIIEAGRFVRRDLTAEQPAPGVRGNSGTGMALGKPAPVAPDLGTADPAAIAQDGHRRQFQDFVDAIDEGRQPRVGGADARATLELVLAVYESARRGAEVRLPLTPVGSAG